MWLLATQVMDPYKQARLKGQKLKLATLIHKPKFKQNYLPPIRSLDEAVQCSLLQEVVDGKLSLAELQVQASKRKQVKNLHQAFIRLTTVSNWEEAQSTFPNFTTDDQLNRFLHLDLKKFIPKSFSDFFQEAKHEVAKPSIQREGHTAVVLVVKVTEVCGSNKRDRQVCKHSVVRPMCYLYQMKQ